MTNFAHKLLYDPSNIPVRSHFVQPSSIFTNRMNKFKTVAFHTLGCKLNFAETSSLSRLVEGAGFTKKDFEDLADIYVVNTCSVTENADKECRQLVRRIQRRAPGSMVVITGCYAQLKPQEIARIPGVDLVLGAAEKFNLAHHLKELTKGDSSRICSCDIQDVDDFHPAFSIHDRTRTFLKVQDGCDYTCSFCTIPMARGKSRSASVSRVVANAQWLASQGIREIVLTGVNLGDFGHSPLASADGEENFFSLVQALDRVDGIDRYRISSIEPNLLTNEIIELVSKSTKFMPHFHIPLQSGSNRILGLMRRRYKRELYADRVRTILAAMPHAAIGADVIVGFPTETETDFQETYAFLSSQQIAYLHVFTYSERDHTRALDLTPQVPMRVRHERNRVLRHLSWEKMQQFTQSQVGVRRKVLFERQSKDAMMEGYSDNYIKVVTPYRPEWVNQIVDWTL